LAQPSNIILIGMPGSGKSTLGRRLAQQRRLRFVDTDLMLERRENMPIQAIVNRRGIRHLRQIEADVLSSLSVNECVIATGGSAVYSDLAMQHLGDIGARVYLQISLPTLVARVNNVASRGLAKMKSHPLPRLYAERVDLYQAHADIIANNDRPMTALSMHALNRQLDHFFEV